MGRGRNKSLKQLQVVDESSNRINTYHDRYDIENTTTNNDRKHLKKACSSKIHNNPTRESFPNDSIRKKTI